MASGSLRNDCKGEVNNDLNENNDAGKYRINSNKTTISKTLEYQTKITTRTPAEYSRLDVDFNVPIKHLSNFWISPDLSLIICNIKLNLRRTRKCIIFEI